MQKTCVSVCVCVYKVMRANGEGPLHLLSSSLTTLEDTEDNNSTSKDRKCPALISCIFSSLAQNKAVTINDFGCVLG